MAADRTWYVFRNSAREVVAPLVDGTPFLDGVRVSLSESGKPNLTLKLSVEDGQPVLDSLLIERLPGPNADRHGGPKITASDVHKIALESIVRDAIRSVAASLAITDWSETDQSTAAAAAEAAIRTRRRRVLDDAFLNSVAKVAMDNPDRPTRAVAEELFTSHRTATRWIGEARRRGFMEDTNKETPS
jgi:hypothetical protein